MEPMTVIGVVSALAGAIVAAWRGTEQSRQKALDREHQARLQAAQHSHEMLLVQLRQGTRNEEPSIIPTSSTSRYDPLHERLQVEAEHLSALNFEVVFESVRGGYGLALPLAEKTVLVFWLDFNYPSSTPLVLIWSGSAIDEIEFAAGSWSRDRTLAEIVSALWPYFRDTASTESIGKAKGDTI